MRTVRFLMAASLFLCAASARPARADDTADAKKAIEANYAKIAEAMNNYDAKAVGSYYTPDFVEGPNRNVKVVPGGFQRGLPKLMIVLRATKTHSTMKTVIKSISIKGNEATVTTESTGTVTMTEPHVHKTITTPGTTHTAEDVWIKKGNTWLCKYHNNKR